MKCTCDDEVQSRVVPGPQLNRAPTHESTGTLHTRQSRPFSPLAGQEVKYSLKIRKRSSQRMSP